MLVGDVVHLHDGEQGGVLVCVCVCVCVCECVWILSLKYNIMILSSTSTASADHVCIHTSSLECRSRLVARHGDNCASTPAYNGLYTAADTSHVKVQSCKVTDLQGC